MKRTAKELDQLTKDDFKAYERVRASGVTNMFDVRMVERLSGLDGDTILGVMKNYDSLVKKFPGVRKGT